MRTRKLILTSAIAVLLGGALAAGTSSPVAAASYSQRVCETILGGVWDKKAKTCLIPEEETKPGKPNNGNGTWDEFQELSAHGNLNNNKSTSDEVCDGPGNSTSKC